MNWKNVSIATIAILSMIIVAESSIIIYDNFKCDEKSTEDVINEVIPYVVSIECNDEDNSSKGTGFITAYNGKTIIITNAHIVTYEKNEMMLPFKSITCKFYNSNEDYELTMNDYSNELDLSILSFKNEIGCMCGLTITNNSSLKYGTNIFTIGNAMGLGLSATTGIISTPLIKDTASHNERLLIQTDLVINKGNSGGPLCDSKGNVVGIVSSKYTGFLSTSEGISFAIPSSTILSYLSNTLKTTIE